MVARFEMHEAIFHNSLSKYIAQYISILASCLMVRESRPTRSEIHEPRSKDPYKLLHYPRPLSLIYIYQVYLFVPHGCGRTPIQDSLLPVHDPRGQSHAS